MKRGKISLAILAIIIAAGSAFTTKTITYTDASGLPITEAQYFSCPNIGHFVCGIKWDNDVEIERRYHDE